MKITTQTLRDSPSWVKLAPLCADAGLPSSRIKMKVRESRELSEEESKALTDAFERGLDDMKGVTPWV